MHILSPTFIIMKVRILLSQVLFVVLTLTFSAYAQTATAPAAGDGSAGAPYQIATLDNLYWLSQSDSVWSKHFIQTADIDASETETWFSGSGFPYIGGLPFPFGEDTVAFSGYYNGKGYSISDLHTAFGLFSFLDNAVIDSVHIRNEVVSGEFIFAGLLAAMSQQSSIRNSSVSGVVATGTLGGGFVGNSTKSTYLNSYAFLNIETEFEAGGILGVSERDTLINTYSSGSVESSIAGGLISSADTTYVFNSYSKTKVGGTTSGGLIGSTESYNTITSSYWDTETSGQATSEGGTGLTMLEMLSQSSFMDWDFDTIWAINEESSYPYLAWQGGAEIHNLAPFQPPSDLQTEASDSTVMLTWSEPFPLADTPLGYNVYRGADTKVAELISGTTYIDSTLANFVTYEFSVSAVYDSSGTNVEKRSSSVFAMPVFFKDGIGTETDPYLVETAEELDSIRANLGAHYRLIADIDLDVSPYNTGSGWVPIGNSTDPFQGSFDGDEFTISGLFINGAGTSGLFGEVDGGTLTSVTLENVNINGGTNTGALVGSVENGEIINSGSSGTISGGSYDYIGGLVGSMDSTAISNSYSKASVSGGGSVGGLVGMGLNYENSIQTSYATGSVNGTFSSIGGLVGTYFGGEIVDSYATGDVSGNQYVAGLVGYLNNDVSVEYCYSAGAISGNHNAGGFAGFYDSAPISESYWDSSASGLTNPVGAGSATGITGYTSSEMAVQSNFTNWDFEDTWSIVEDVSFPFLQGPEPDTYPGDNLGIGQVLGSSIEFNSSEFQYMELGDPAAISGIENITVEMWVKPGSFTPGSTHRLMVKDDEWYLEIGNSNDIAWTIHGDASNRVSSGTLTLDNWVHVAGTYDGSEYCILLNGTETDCRSFSSGIPDSGYPLTLAARRNNDAAASEFFQGSIDEVRIWDHVRTGDEIRATMFQKLSGDEAGLAGYWPLDEGTGTTASDKTANENQGTLVNAPAWDIGTAPMGTFISGDEGWRMFSIPVEGATYAEILEPFWTQGFTGADVPNGTPNVYTWSESTQTFEELTDAGNQAELGNGFIVYIFEDDDYDGEGDGFPKMIQTHSNQHIGAVSPAITFTDTGLPADDGWNMLGNPFGATIDWDDTEGWYSENIDASFYVWSDTANNGSGAYLSWNGATGTLGSGLIAPWQGFWIKAHALNPSIKIRDAGRSYGGVFMKNKAAEQIKFTLKGGGMMSGAVLHFNENAETGKDPLDAWKLQSLNRESLALYTMLEDGSALDINALPTEFGERIDIPLDFELSTVGAIHELPLRLGWNLNALPNGLNAWLTDTETGKIIDLGESTTYEFALGDRAKTSTVETQDLASLRHGVVNPTVLKAKSSGSEASPRFTLTLSYGEPVATEPGDALPQTFALDQNYPNPFNPSTVIRYQLPVNSEVSLKVFDVLGREVANLIDGRMEAGYHQLTFNARDLASGMYIYRLQAGSTVITRKLSLIK